MTRRTLCWLSLVLVVSGAEGCGAPSENVSSLEASAAPVAPQVPVGEPYFHDLGKFGLGAEVTVFVVYRAGCDPCNESLDFYKKLLSLPRMNGTDRRFVLLAVDGLAPAARDLEERGFPSPHRALGIASDAILLPDENNELQRRTARVEGVDLKNPPALIVVGPSGERLGTWVGRLTPQDEADVLAIIQS